jgi:hypothetical protein
VLGVESDAGLTGCPDRGLVAVGRTQPDEVDRRRSPGSVAPLMSLLSSNRHRTHDQLVVASIDVVGFDQQAGSHTRRT